MVSRSCDDTIGMKCGKMGMVIGVMEYKIWVVGLRGIKGWRCGYYRLGLWVDGYGGDHWGWWCVGHQWNGWWNIMGSGFSNHEKWISRESFRRMLEGHAHKFHAHERIGKEMNGEWMVGWVIESSGTNGHYGYGKMKRNSGIGLGFERKKVVTGTFRLHVSISSRWPFHIVFMNPTLLDHHLLHLSYLESILTTTASLNMMPHAPKKWDQRGLRMWFWYIKLREGGSVFKAFIKQRNTQVVHKWSQKESMKMYEKKKSILAFHKYA